MQPQPGPGIGAVASIVAAREPAGDYRRLLAALASRAQRLGSRDPESAAQETFKRSWENPTSRPALAFYFCDGAAPGVPSWTLDQLLAWLHTVLRYVVSEERSRSASRREVSLESEEPSWKKGGVPEPVQHAADQLDVLIQRELEAIVAECFPKLDPQYRVVLKMRVAGMKYEDIAERLGVKENTIATWLSRGMRDLARCVGRRMRRNREQG